MVVCVLNNGIIFRNNHLTHVKNSKLLLFLGVIIIIVTIKIGYAYIVLIQFQDRVIFQNNLEPSNDYINPYNAVRTALIASYYFNVEEIRVTLDKYPEMGIFEPTYSVEIMSKMNYNSFEGGIVSVKIDALTDDIKNISYGRYVVNTIH